MNVVTAFWDEGGGMVLRGFGWALDVRPLLPEVESCVWEVCGMCRPECEDVGVRLWLSV